MRGFGRRFAFEVGFIVLVAVGLAVTHLRWPAIVLLMAAAWLLTAFVEFAAWRRGREHSPGPLARAVARPEPVAPEPEPHVQVLEPAPLSEPEPEREPAPAPVEAQPDSEAGAEEPAAAEPEPRPEPLAVVSEPEPEPPAVEPEVLKVLEPAPAAPRAWNIWELDHLAKAASEERREELSYLLVYLRDFASTEGVLPTDFDELVRESFGDLLAARAL